MNSKAPLPAPAGVNFWGCSGGRQRWFDGDQWLCRAAGFHIWRSYRSPNNRDVGACRSSLVHSRYCKPFFNLYEGNPINLHYPLLQCLGRTQVKYIMSVSSKDFRTQGLKGLRTEDSMLCTSQSECIRSQKTDVDGWNRTNQLRYVRP